MAPERPLFVPLKRHYFEMFRRGEKAVEYRRHGPGWNERTCRIGRRVVLSLGYGRRYRLTGVIRSFEVISDTSKLPGWIECYGAEGRAAAAIGIVLDPPPPK